MESNGKGGKLQVALVTGATSGIGKAVAIELASRGYRVYGTGRNPSQPGKADEHGIVFYPMDVLSETSVHETIKRVIANEQRLDVLVACAGMGIAGSVEDTAMSDADLQMRTNFLGTVLAVKGCLPQMRQQKQGKIVIIGSLAGRIGMPFQAFYSSSKFALEGFVESLRHEVKPFGIDVCIVEPGDFSTGFTAARKKSGTMGSPYSEAFQRTISIQEHDEMHGSDPQVAARAVAGILEKKKMPLRIVVGPVFQKFAAGLKRVIPAKWFELLYKLYYRL